ncbi:MAG: hypothetical protein O2856_06905 [Planctomycetota bacterium]|nr:hypothetical protein [Planctomycetota bacterium]
MLSTALAGKDREIESDLESLILRVQPVSYRWWPRNVPIQHIPSWTLRIQPETESKLYVAFLDNSSETPLNDLDGFAWIGVWATREFEPPENPTGLMPSNIIRHVTRENIEGEDDLEANSSYEDGDVLVLYLTNSAPQAGSWERIRLVAAVPPPANDAE